MIVKLLTQQHLEFLSINGGCTGSSESTLVKMPHCWKSHVTAHLYFKVYLYPRYEVYRGYIVFAFSVIMFVCLSVCLFVCKLFFFIKDFSATTWVRILKFSTRLDSDELYCVTKEQPHIAYQSLYLFIFLSLQWKKFSSKISQQLLGLGF